MLLVMLLVTRKLIIGMLEHFVYYNCERNVYVVYVAQLRLCMCIYFTPGDKKSKVSDGNIFIF